MDQPRLETERLLLRGYEPSDLDELAAHYADPEVVRYLAQGQTRSRDEAHERLTAARFRWDHYRLPLWAVTLKPTNRWIGRCGFQPKEEADPDQVELAYSFVRWSWGHGYATEAVRACIDYVFETMSWPRVIARVRPGNVGSLRVLEKLGFRRLPGTSPCAGAAAIVCELRRS